MNNGERAARWLREVADMVEAKNKAYGDSVGSPLRIFSKAPSDEGIKVRIDDKLSRVARGTASGEDIYRDLVGYIALLATHEEDIPSIGKSADVIEMGEINGIRYSMRIK